MSSSDVVAFASGTAQLGSSLGGMLGAVWADLDGDGCTDGYVWSGRYYQGTPESTETPRIEYETVDLEMVG